MKPSAWRELLLLLAVILAGILLSIGIQKLVIRKKNTEQAASSVEVKIRDLIRSQVSRQGFVIRDQKINRDLETIRARLTDELEEDLPFEIEVMVIDSPVINAAALPGGVILMFSGLLQQADNAEQVAAVMAHEIGHVVNRDSMKKLVREVGLAALLAVSGGDQTAIIREVFRDLVSTGFSRKQEARADDFCFSLLKRCHLDPVHFAGFMQDLVDPDMDQSMKDLLQYISTHPNLTSRIEKARQKSLEFKGPEHLFSINWERSVRSINKKFHN